MFLGVLTPWHIQIAHARVRGRLSWVGHAKSARDAPWQKEATPWSSRGKELSAYTCGKQVTAAGKGGLKECQVGHTKGLIHPNSGHRPLEAFWGQASYSHGNSAWMEGALVPTSGSMQTFLLLGWASNLTLHSAHVGVLGQTPDPPALIDTLGGRPVGIADPPACTFTNTYR